MPSATERLLTAVVDIRDYLTHGTDPDNCPACVRFDELQDATMSVLDALQNAEDSRDAAKADLAEMRDDRDRLSAKNAFLHETLLSILAIHGRYVPDCIDNDSRLYQSAALDGWARTALGEQGK